MQKNTSDDLALFQACKNTTIVRRSGLLPKKGSETWRFAMQTGVGGAGLGLYRVSLDISALEQLTQDV